MARSSKIYLCKDINIDNEYNNVLNYTVQQMLDLCTASSHLVAQASNYAFIRETDNTISVSFTYGDCLQSNYIAFQNPDYSNKWFFAWIKDVKYVNDGTTQITFEVDSWSTWFNDITLKKSFVIREHVNSDNVGEHTLPENFETGEFIINSAPTKLMTYSTEPTAPNGTYIIFAVTDLPKAVSTSGFDINQFRMINGIFGGQLFIVCSDLSNAVSLINDYNGKQEYIQSIFMAPRALLHFNPGTGGAVDDRTHVFSLDGGGTYRVAEPASGVLYHLNGAVQVAQQKTININTTINGYTPKNKKLFVAPWNYGILTNNTGVDVEMHYEDFVNNTPTFTAYGTLTPGCSIKCIPLNYKKLSDSSSIHSYNFGISGAKFPICSWTCDEFINWLTQNGVNIAVSTVTGLVSLGVGIATGGVGLAVGVTSGMNSIANTASQIYTRSKVPESTKGNLNSGDVTFSIGESVFTFIPMCIKQEYARVIDSYWTRYGYLVNALKTPNITGRTYWNYIQISSGEELGVGAVPTKYMDVINQVARKGVTIWHDHANIGNYDLNNTIVSS